jgi:hypothetical protein
MEWCSVGAMECSKDNQLAVRFSKQQDTSGSKPRAQPFKLQQVKILSEREGVL